MRKQKIIHIDNDPEVISANYKTELSIVSDAKLFLDDFNDLNLSKQFNGKEDIKIAKEKKWRDFVKQYSLGDVQLWAGKDFNFQQDYQINGIPRFILIDPNGNIVDSDAPRPSDPSLKNLLDSVL